MEAGKKVKRIWEPSNGGIGNKLKRAKSKLIKTIQENITLIPGIVTKTGKNLRANPKIRAKTIFAPGPAKADFAGPYFWSRKL